MEDREMNAPDDPYRTDPSVWRHDKPEVGRWYKHPYSRGGIVRDARHASGILRDALALPGHFAWRYMTDDEVREAAP
jgi:hypothetical protein